MKEPNRKEERSCHNCNFHCMNHNSCDVNGICKQGEKWQPVAPEADEIKDSINNAIEGWFARKRQSAKGSGELKNAILKIFYLYRTENITPEADINTPFFGNTGAKIPMTETMRLLPDSDRDWKEDFSHENGNYMNMCTRCGRFFKGHKRRVICVECYKKGDYQPHKSAEEILHAKRLKEMVGLSLSYGECLSFVYSIYASQKTEIPEITDEEIEKWARMMAFGDIIDETFKREKTERSIQYFRYESLIVGANWYREELKRRSAGTITTKDLKDIDDANDDKGKV